MGMHWELKETAVGTREKWKKSSIHPLPLHSQTLKGKKPRHFECMIEPAHWLHKISLPKRVHHPFLPGIYHLQNTLPIDIYQAQRMVFPSWHYAIFVHRYYHLLYICPL
jgi:hypothetical protein